MRTHASAVRDEEEFVLPGNKRVTTKVKPVIADDRGVADGVEAPLIWTSAFVTLDVRQATSKARRAGGMHLTKQASVIYKPRDCPAPR